MLPSQAVRKEMRTTAGADLVWEAWTDPDRLSQWFCDQATGWPGVGGTLNMTWERFGFTVHYDVAEMEGRKRMVLKSWIPGVGTQSLELEIRRRAPYTILQLVESSPPGKIPESESGVESGWEMALAILRHYLENYYGQDRSSFFAMLPAEFTYEGLMPFFTRPEKLELWLTRPGSVTEMGSAGEPFRCILDSGETMSGTVLAVTRHEVLLGWDEIRGFLELKSFPTGPGTRALCLRGSGYGLSADRAAQIEQSLKEALVRLFAALARSYR
ncbi:MAG: SRPBCC domain-containing protein [Armatimonadetes bacterium]|nr:SRPBCC domain-containing protein [Armatimonadota bacterium]